MSVEERYYVREVLADSTDPNHEHPHLTWWIRDRLYNCKDVVHIEARGKDGHAVTRGRANGLCIRLNREYQEWLQQPSA